MNVLIVEDEMMAQANLARALTQHFPDVRIVGTTGSVRETVLWLRTPGNSADVIFMDVELSDGDCFEIFRQADVTARVIMTTAYDNYAVRAFEVNSIDYLLKPIDLAALRRAVERCRVRSGLDGVKYSFTNSQGYGDYKFIGFKNYIAMFQDARVGHAYLFTIFIAILITLGTNILGMFLAVLLNSKIAFKNGFRAIFFIPYTLSVLVIGYVFKYIFMTPLPALGQALHIDWLSTSMISNPDLAWFPIVFLSIWQGVAYSTLLYLAGLQTIDNEIYEAAAIDGVIRGSTQMLAQFTTHCLVAFARSVYMLHRDCQGYKLIHEPRHIDFSFFFRYDNQIITLFGIFMSELHQQLICRTYRLFHVIQTAIAWNPHHSVCLKIQFESTRCFLYNQNNIDFALLHLRTVNISEEKVIQYKFIFA